MPIPARYSRTSPCSRSERFSSGIRRTAMALNSQVLLRESPALCSPRADQHFHQELQNFNMALGFLQARSPSIKPMLSQKKTMDAGALPQGFRNMLTQLNHVLRILKNRQPLTVLVRADAFQSFQHLVSFERDATLCSVRPRKDRAPNRMRVQNRTGAHTVHDGQMQQGFRGRPAMAADDVSRFIHLQELHWRKAALVQAR